MVWFNWEWESVRSCVERTVCYELSCSCEDGRCEWWEVREQSVHGIGLNVWRIRMGFVVVDDVKVKENALLWNLSCGIYNRIWSWKSESDWCGGGGRLVWWWTAEVWWNVGEERKGECSALGYFKKLCPPCNMQYPYQPIELSSIVFFYLGNKTFFDFNFFHLLIFVCPIFFFIFFLENVSPSILNLFYFF